MDSSNGKRGTDMEVGIQNREKVIAEVNNLFTDPKDIIISRFHEYLKIMNPRERMIKNLLIHRMVEMGMDDNMGLDYVMNQVDNSKQTFLAIRWWSDPTLFFKNVSKMPLNEFVNEILVHFHFLILNPPQKHKPYLLTRYCLISVKEILTFAKPVLDITPGNKNRILFRNGNNTLTPSRLPKIPILGGIRGMFEKDPSLSEALRKLLI